MDDLIKYHEERCSGKPEESAVAFSDGLEGLIDWLKKEHINLKESQKRVDTENLSNYVWGQVNMLEKVASKIAELRKAA